uniref:Uncharacterized protein n=1 Tax=Brassica oleracea var. oleracea TaxID=109376 RepID=A0A0D3D7Y3_BRAOL
MFRKSFRMNKPLFLRIVERINEYLRRPTPEDLQRLLDVGEVRGFPGMIGSIDCMHWKWKNCPTAWKGTLNDINVFDRSPVFDDILQGRTPKVKFKANNHTYRMTYYLTDGIYPNWATFILNGTSNNFESSLRLARGRLKSFRNAAGGSPHVARDIIMKLQQMQAWSLDYVVSAKNSIAMQIAESVTADQRYQSYISKDGPSWLRQQLESEAKDSSSGCS